MATPVTAKDMRRFRLSTQRIRGSGIKGSGLEGSGIQALGGQETPDPRASSAAGVTRQLLAVQAQDFPQALWALGLRTPNATRAEVLAALTSGQLVRSSPLRGTLFFVAAEDLRWMLSITAERSLSSMATRHGQLGLDAATFDRARDVAETALAGTALGRDEFLHAIEHHGISTDGQRGYHIIWNLAQRGIVCWGPPHGRQQALVLVADWIPQQPALDREDALCRLAQRYFTGHGPATLADLAWWAKLTMTDARTALALARPLLTELTLDGASHWIASEEAEMASSAPPSVYALPGFDEYLLGYQDRSLALAPEHANRVVPGGNGIFLPTVVVDGKVVGTWRRAKSGGKATITAEAFDTLSTRHAAAFAREGRRYRAFAGPRD
jgi:hypothetical protein